MVRGHSIAVVVVGHATCGNAQDRNSCTSACESQKEDSA